MQRSSHCDLLRFLINNVRCFEGTETLPVSAPHPLSFPIGTRFMKGRKFGGEVVKKGVPNGEVHGNGKVLKKERSLEMTLTNA